MQSCHEEPNKCAYAWRLQQERVRLGWSVQYFCRQCCIACDRWKLLTHCHSATPTAEELQRMAMDGVDIHYILTGHRQQPLTTEEAALLENYRESSASDRECLEKTYFSDAQ